MYGDYTKIDNTRYFLRVEAHSTQVSEWDEAQGAYLFFGVIHKGFDSYSSDRGLKAAIRKWVRTEKGR